MTAALYICYLEEVKLTMQQLKREKEELSQERGANAAMHI